jgi:hypothetical protein
MEKKFDEGLLFQEVTGINVDWMENYGNTPRIQLEGPAADYKVRAAWFQAAIWKQYPIQKSSLWITTHPNGFVRYLSHSGDNRNEGGFGGSNFDIHLEDGTQKVLKGPWSSRATCVNMVVPPEDHVMDTDQGAIRIDAFLALCEKVNFPHYVVRGVKTEGEPEAVRISTRPDGVYKPSGNKCWDGVGEFEVLYAPKEA